ncbi:hypothetical protein GLW08_10405 [Pontibacillus yanchengensis]|uniref:Uncharacterized protein n=1 Tax=Pontibacillus yanchengensis TaxID=462910 RepID=A0ACC7VG41_9BACI|nr:recombinase family protein [Pontibacillus yanchengensis]MYL53747.1 hypothetical protein [Pontibacillus yanchengensis]
MGNGSKTAVGYVRTSGEVNPSHSIDNQIKRINEYCRDKGIILREVLVDEKKTGTKVEGRDAYKKLKNLIDNGLINLLIITFFDRVGREAFELVGILTTLKNKGIEVYSIEENLNISKMSPLQIAIIALQAEHENKNRAKLIHGSRERSKQEGKYTSKPPYGYRKDQNGFLVKEEAEAQVVQKIYSMFLEGKSLKDIYTWLNDNSIPAPDNKKWDVRKVRIRLLTKTYVGRWYASPKKSEKNTYEYRLISDKEHPSIISLETFEKVKEILETNIKKTPRKKHFHFLSKILICPLCGEKMQAKVPPTNAYYCDKKACDYKGIKKEVIEPQVLQLLKEQGEKEEEYYEFEEKRNTQSKDVDRLLKKKNRLEKKFALAEINQEQYETEVNHILTELTYTKEKEQKSMTHEKISYKKYIQPIENNDLEKVKEYMLRDKLTFTLSNNSKVKEVTETNI